MANKPKMQLRRGKNLLYILYLCHWFTNKIYNCNIISTKYYCKDLCHRNRYCCTPWLMETIAFSKTDRSNKCNNLSLISGIISHFQCPSKVNSTNSIWDRKWDLCKVPTDEKDGNHLCHFHFKIFIKCFTWTIDMNKKINITILNIDV